MNRKYKEVHKNLERYFGLEKHDITIFSHKGRMFIGVEYEDFRPLKTVEREIRSIVGVTTQVSK